MSQLRFHEYLSSDTHLISHSSTHPLLCPIFLSSASSCATPVSTKSVSRAKSMYAFRVPKRSETRQEERGRGRIADRSRCGAKGRNRKGETSKNEFTTIRPFYRRAGLETVHSPPTLMRVRLYLACLDNGLRRGRLSKEIQIELLRITQILCNAIAATGHRFY